ncbi:hypothetical protein Bca52824_058802 [Brassica carinata]|uniref:Uncharacterized protein n=1 Tax=Brassica carinata TaxID=52824 RepID=A0A8X7QTX3_BRACI|nr:hypothetical protein Bca52824_058802 [Brassica carinata]
MNLTLVLVLKLDGGLNHYPSPPCLRRHLSLSRARRRSNNKPNAVVLVVVSSGAKLMRQKKMVFVGVTAEKIGVQGDSGQPPKKKLRCGKIESGKGRLSLKEEDAC